MCKPQQLIRLAESSVPPFRLAIFVLLCQAAFHGTTLALAILSPVIETCDSKAVLPLRTGLIVWASGSLLFLAITLYSWSVFFYKTLLSRHYEALEEDDQQEGAYCQTRLIIFYIQSIVGLFLTAFWIILCVSLSNSTQCKRQDYTVWILTLLAVIFFPIFNCLIGCCSGIMQAACPSCCPNPSISL